MVEDSVDRKRQHRPQRELAFACHAPLSIVLETDLAEAHGADQAAQIGRGIFDIAQLGENAAIDEAELARIERQVVLAERLDQPVESPPDQCRCPTVLQRSADAVYDVIALAPQGEHRRNELGWILEVAIDLNRAVASRCFVCGQQRALIADLRLKRMTRTRRSARAISFRILKVCRSSDCR